MIKKLICISCPRGCHLEVNDVTLEVSGNMCPKGKIYGQSEVTNPVRTVTSTVALIGKDGIRLAVKTAHPIPKGKIFEVMEEINKVVVKAPIKMGEVIIKNVANTGIDIISSEDIYQ